MLPVTTLTINISSVALIWFGGMRIDAGQMQVGSLIAFLSYFMQILMAVLMATLLLVMLPRASVCAERITEVLATDDGDQQPGHRRGVPPAASAARSTLDDATFCYPGRRTPCAGGCFADRAARARRRRSWAAPDRASRR